MRHVLGIISDTHGMLRPAALDALRGCEHILHAGDVGDPDILDRLREIAPVTAVRGNVDHGAWAERLPRTECVEFGDVQIYMLHILDTLDVEPTVAGISVVLYGHTHQPSEEYRDGVLFLNPGSAGPRRFHLPQCLARLTLEDGALQVEFVDLD